MKKILVLLVSLFISSQAFAAIQTQNVEYKDKDAVLEGYMAYDDAVQGPRPGVLVIHEWMGLNDYAKKRAEQLAALGYTAFAADIYGKGIRPKDYKEAGEQAGIYKGNRSLMRERVLAGLKILSDSSFTDKSKIAAIGYCFGGTAVLELARSGAEVRGVVSFHGGLDSPKPEDAKNIKTRILVLHGADDPFAPAKQVADFEDEMKKGGVADWQVVLYSNTVHAFTNPDSGSDPSKGAAYNPSSDKRSWEAMKQFFGEIFKS